MHFFRQILVMDDDLLQFLEDVFSGGGHDEDHRVGISQGVVLSEV